MDPPATAVQAAATPGATTPPAPATADSLRPSFQFHDEARERGITGMNHCGQPADKKYLLQEMGNGCALFDYDGDGDLDAYVVDGCTLRPPPEGQRGDWTPNNDGQCRLYENDGSGFFRDVSESTGTDFTGFGQGVSIADFDNDGDPDIYVTCWGPNLLYRNEGLTEGRVQFREVGVEACVADPFWSVGSTWFDAEGDGDLDLYVTNYFAMAVERDRTCWSKIDCGYQDVLAACGPKGMVGEPDRLYLNQGDGTFVDGSAERGIHAVDARFGLGVVSFDYDLDGDMDIYAANDSRGNFLFENDGTGHFLEIADFAGCSLNRTGVAQAGMGIACGDFEGDLDADLFLTNFSHDNNTFYSNQGGLDFLETTRRLRFSEEDYFALSWGTEFLDLDNDGDMDLVICSGHVYPEADQRSPEITFKQQNRVYEQGPEGLRDVTASCGPGLERRASSRGMAAGDIDDDGDLDLLITELNEPPTLLVNHLEGGGHYLQITLSGTQVNRDAVGAKLLLKAAGRTWYREVRSGHSYASFHDPRQHFGLGDAVEIECLTVIWPGGEQQEFRNLAVDHALHIRQGVAEPEVLR